MKKILIIISLLVHVVLASATQIPTATTNGSQDNRNVVYAFIHARIFIDSKNEIQDASLLVQNNKILNVGQSITIPDNAVVYDLQGASIYPGFILLDSDYGLSKVPAKQSFSFSGKETLSTTTKGPVNANEAIKASYQSVSDFHHDKEKAKTLRAMGFSTVLSYKHDGIMRGSSVLVDLNDKTDQQSIIKTEQAFHLSFDKGSSKQLYPYSLMGAVALLRQTWLDAGWYKDGPMAYTDLDLEAVNVHANSPQIFAVKNWQQTLLADKIAKEFNKNIVIKSGGDEYKHVDAIKKINRSLIVPLSFPKAMEVSDELDAWNAPLDKMMEWEAAPYNLYYLDKNNIEFSIIPGQHKTFLKDLRKAVAKGLPKSSALAALTSTPAKVLFNQKLGHLNRGASANFIIVDGDVFEKDAQIAENWVAGQRYVVNKISVIKSGIYQLKMGEQSHEIELTNAHGKLQIKNTDEDSEIKYKASLNNEFIRIEIIEEKQSTKLLGLFDRNSMHSIVGQSPVWSNQRISDLKSKEGKEKKDPSEKDKAPLIARPFSPYGLHQPIDAKTFLITNATVWTNEKQGVLKATDVFIKDGKIAEIGRNLGSKAEQVIDGTHLHLTAGIVDEHSHIALLSVNDVAVNSSMVRMQDALDSDDINIYRNLAGGVTAAQLLHGSANPIGGQSALIKMRWGSTSDALLIKGADSFIKFALGENVKNSSSQQSIRYPLTRMGVEQVYRDAFTNALAYEKQWQRYNKGGQSKRNGNAPRRDLMLEAVLEIVDKNRFVSCHSYVQSEINMLMKVAEDFDFNINTFTHILEGYKVADKMLAHGVGASTFSDWWSYKWEVNHAIPYNASLMSKKGITTAINSDDPEMSRRLNQEAAKSIKYGGMSEEQALKMVTLNPAKLLHLDDRLGSIKIGKDADIVLWSDNPLSIYAKATKTFVDGKLLYDRDNQTQIEEKIAQERARLIKKINQSDQPKMPAIMPPKKHMQCESITGYEYLLGAE